MPCAYRIGGRFSLILRVTRVTPPIPISCFRAIHKLDRANSVVIRKVYGCRETAPVTADKPDQLIEKTWPVREYWRCC
jgi:hypothetical protein